LRFSLLILKINKSFEVKTKTTVLEIEVVQKSIESNDDKVPPVPNVYPFQSSSLPCTSAGEHVVVLYNCLPEFSSSMYVIMVTIIPVMFHNCNHCS